MDKAPPDTAQIDIAAPADQVYELVADITNMGRWSPETYRTTWLGSASAPVPGAAFRGWNHAKLGPVPIRWFTKSVIRQADPGRAFSFDTVTSGARWTYRFEPTADGDGCTVTETREEIASPVLVKVAWVSSKVSGIRRQQLADGMQVTLDRLKAAAESARASTPT